jgi:SNF2 family DNA or RNA helicase
MIFTPRPYQVPLADHIFQHRRCAIWAGMGMGKTSGTLYALDALQMVEDSPTLILAPLRVAQSTWPAEVKKWDNFNHFKIVPIIGTAKERLEAMREPADIHTMNYENLPWLLEQVRGSWPWTTVVSDESTRLKSFRLTGGKKAKDEKAVYVPKTRVSRARTLAKVAYSRIERFIELTGTPSPNGLLDLWGQLWFLDRGERLGRTFEAFKQRWFYYEHPNARKPTPTEYGKKEIMDRVKDICLSLRAQDYFDIKDPILVDVPVELPAPALKLYKQMEREMFLELKGKEVEAFNAAAKSMKCLQLANGAIYTDELKNWEPVHEAKLEALESIIEEAAGMPVLVAYHFNTDLARLKKRFPYGKELDKKGKIIDDWNAGKVPLLFLHPASAGHGLNLQDGGNIVAIFGHWWDLEQYQQVIERIGPMRQFQAGHDRPVYVYNIRAVDTIDDLVIQSRTDKRGVQDLLLEAASRI